MVTRGAWDGGLEIDVAARASVAWDRETVHASTRSMGSEGGEEALASSGWMAMVLSNWLDSTGTCRYPVTGILRNNDIEDVVRDAGREALKQGQEPGPSCMCDENT